MKQRVSIHGGHMFPEFNVKPRQLLFALAACTLAFLLPNVSAVAGYPERIVKIVVPFAPGGGTDSVARTLAQEMARDLGQSVIIENKPGAGTIIGTQAVATSEPDGYTLLMETFANAVNPSLNSKLPYDPHKDFAAVALVARSFNIVVVNAKSPYRSIADLIAAAKAEPDKLSYGTYGTGTSAHLAGELFKSLAKVNLTTVPYKGAAPAITDLLGGQIQVMFTTVASAASLIAGGQLRALAVTSAERSPAFPDVPGGRGRRSRLFGRELVWPVRAGQDAARDHRPSQQIGRGCGQVRGLQQARRQRGAGHGGEPAGRARPLCPRRRSALAQGDPGRRHQDRVEHDPEKACPALG
jgi:tripartite-type tricarboxylate transporter receptor subunit TctC